METEPPSRRAYRQFRDLFQVESKETRKLLHTYMCGMPDDSYKLEVWQTVRQILRITGGLERFLRQIQQFTGEDMGDARSLSSNFPEGLGIEKTQAMLFFLCCEHNSFYRRHPRYEKDDPTALGLWQLIPGAPPKIEFTDLLNDKPELPLQGASDRANQRDGSSAYPAPTKESLSKNARGASTETVKQSLWRDVTGQQRPSDPSNPQPLLHYPDIELYEPPRDGDGGESTRSWLSPLVTNALPFTGREDELAQLNAFVADPRPFLIWAISAPSGAGKTRLVTHWMRLLRSRTNPT